jgi:hypothetical protein
MFPSSVESFTGLGAFQASVHAGFAFFVMVFVRLTSRRTCATELRARSGQSLDVLGIGIAITSDVGHRARHREHVHDRALTVGHEVRACGEVIGTARHAKPTVVLACRRGLHDLDERR